MAQSIESNLAIINRIAVRAPFDSPESTDIPNDAVRLCRNVLTLPASERVQFDQQFTERFSEFQKRSLLARVATLCEAYFNTNNLSYLEAAMFLYDLTRRFVDWRECKINLAIILHTMNSLDAITRQAGIKAVFTSLPSFATDYAGIVNENIAHTTLDYFNLELKSSSRGYRFQPK